MCVRKYVEKKKQRWRRSQVGEKLVSRLPIVFIKGSFYFFFPLVYSYYYNIYS